MNFLRADAAHLQQMKSSISFWHLPIILYPIQNIFLLLLLSSGIVGSFGISSSSFVRLFMIPLSNMWAMCLLCAHIDSIHSMLATGFHVHWFWFLQCERLMVFKCIQTLFAFWLHHSNDFPMRNFANVRQKLIFSFECCQTFSPQLRSVSLQFYHFPFAVSPRRPEMEVESFNFSWNRVHLGSSRFFYLVFHVFELPAAPVYYWSSTAERNKFPDFL